MLNSLPIIIFITSLLGFLAGLGVGGGSLLILWLTLVLDMPYSQARILNLLFFIPSALITSFFRCKEGKLQLRPILPGILAGCVAAFLFSILSGYLDKMLLKKILGILFLAVGAKELFYKPKA